MATRFSSAQSRRRQPSSAAASTSHQESHPLTNAWKDGIDAFNKCSDLLKMVKVDVAPIEFDLNNYVLEQCLAAVQKLMMEKE